MYARSLLIIAAAASFTVASALAGNAPANPEKPDPGAAQAASRSVGALSESQSRIWQQELVAHLNKYKRYPHGLPDRGAEVVIRFGLDRKGHVVASKVEKSSGDAVIDEAALATVRRADPLPLPPQSFAGKELTFLIPIRFALSTMPRSQ
jgi:protein TonB